jgi:hypothetical protein
VYDILHFLAAPCPTPLSPLFARLGYPLQVRLRSFPFTPVRQLADSIPGRWRFFTKLICILSYTLLDLLKNFMENKAIAMQNPRKHELDWLRIIAIFLLIFFHAGMWFNPWEWHVKNSELSGSFRYWMIWMHYWRMPLLLFISGAGTYIAIGKRTIAQFTRERLKRLFVPLIVGIFIIVPPQIYFEHIAQYAGYWDFYKTVFEFVPYPAGSFSWHHLWFVAYLLVYSLLAIPLLLLLRSARAERIMLKVLPWMSSPAGMLFIPSFFILITQVLLRPYFPDQTHDLTDVSYIVFYGAFYGWGIMFYAVPSLWSSIHHNRKYLLGAALFVLLPFYGTYFHFREITSCPGT